MAFLYSETTRVSLSGGQARAKGEDSKSTSDGGEWTGKDQKCLAYFIFAYKLPLSPVWFLTLHPEEQR